MRTSDLTDLIGRPLAPVLKLRPVALTAVAILFATSCAHNRIAASIPHISGKAQTLYVMRYQDIKLGDGKPAEAGKFYTVHYTGWTADGKKFDSSLDHNEPITFQQGKHRVIVGWDTGFEGMRVGGKRRLLIPYQLAYGEKGRGPIPPKSELIFDIELLNVQDTPPASSK
jgi:peptidylprolyl isomerase